MKIIKKGGTARKTRPFTIFLFLFKEEFYLRQETDYLLKYISNDTYQKILNSNHNFTIEDLIDNRVDVDLNIRYLIHYGVKKIDVVVLERLDDLLLNHNNFIKKIKDYEGRLTKSGVIDMFENS